MGLVRLFIEEVEGRFLNGKPSVFSEINGISDHLRITVQRDVNAIPLHQNGVLDDRDTAIYCKVSYR